ncbi:putative ribonuclease H-like domain-containing protein [Tanacetum coccineum]
MSESMPTIPTQSTFTYPDPNPSASPSFTQDDTSESFIPELTQPMPTFGTPSGTFTQTAFSQPAFSQPIFSQPAVHFQPTQPSQPTGQQYPNNVQTQQFQHKGTRPKRLGKDARGNTIVHPPVSLDEHVAVQRENKVRTLLLQALPEDHMPDFHHYDDARDIWVAVKARFGGNEESKKMRKTMLKQQFAEFSVTEEEGLHKGYDRFQKILSQLNQVQARPDNDDINLKFLRALPSSWSQVALALKTRGGLESMSFDDLYNKLRSLELDVRIGHSYGVKVASAPTSYFSFFGAFFIGTAAYCSKHTYSDQQRIVSQSFSDIWVFLINVDSLEMEEMDLKMAKLGEDACCFFPPSQELICPPHISLTYGKPTRGPMHPVIPASRPRPKTSHLLLTSGTLSKSVVKTKLTAAILVLLTPAGWSKRPAPVSAGRPVSAGDDGILLLRPQQVTLGGIKDHSFGDPRGDPSTDNDIGIVDSGCSRSMTGNKEKLADFVPIKGGIVKFGGGDGRISGKGTIRTSKLDFENVYYVEELQHFNLFSVSQICDKKNKVLFTDTDCLVLSEEFQLPDASQVVLRIPRKHDLYTFHISHLQPEQKVTCLVAKASLDESTRWHRRMAHVNFKTINKLAKEGLVDGLPLKVFSNEHNCVACNKGKQHKASYKHISAVRFITDTLQLLHMDLFGPTNIRSIDQKYYSLVVTDDFSRFSWTFFLGTKDETFYVLKEFITLIENQLNKKVKGIRCDNGTEFKNAKLIELCGEKGIKRDYSNPRTPQQNGVAERKNRTLIEAARTMLADSKLPTMFWTEAVSTACYVLNRVSITNPHNKTPYELISGKVPQISHLKPFGCQVTILNTSDYLGKFEGKADDGYLVGYASNSKAYRVYNLPNKRVEETLNLRFLEDKPNVQGIGHEWYFDLDYLTDSLGYTRFKTDTPAGTQETNINAGTQDHDSDSEVDEQVIVVPSFPSNRFAGPSSSNGPSIMERNADYAEELAKLQRQEYEAKDAAARYGYLFSQATAEILCQAEAEIRNQGVSAVRDPAGIDSAVRDPADIDSAVRDTAAINSAGDVSDGSPSAGSDPAGGNPADSSQPAGSFEPADESNPAVSSSISADYIPVYADESTLPPGQSLGSSANTTRFPLPSDVCMDQLSSGIFTSSSYDDDFRATLTNLAPVVDVNLTPVIGCDILLGSEA